MPINLKERTNKTKKVEELKKALEVGADGTPVNFHWKNDDAKEFIDFIKDQSSGVLKKFRVIPMSGPTKEIAKIIDRGDFLKPGGSYKRSNGNEGDDGYEFGNESIELVTKKIEGKIYISDDELADNIEGNKLETHIKRLISIKIQNEIAKASIYAKAVTNPNGKNGILNVFNGAKYLIEKNNGGVLDMTTKSTRDISRKVFVVGKKILDEQYQDEAELLLGGDVLTNINELYNDPDGNRGTGETSKKSINDMNINKITPMKSNQPVVDRSVGAITTGAVAVGVTTIPVDTDLTASINIGDNIVTNEGKANEIVYKVVGITSSNITFDKGLLYSLSQGDTVHKASLDGADSIIGNPKNIIVGIELDMRMEAERLAPDGWNYWYKMRMDIQIENPKAMVLVKNLKANDLNL